MTPSPPPPTQAMLPQARVVYVSATGASELRHMGFMDRLGLWDISSKFSGPIDFCQVLIWQRVGRRTVLVDATLLRMGLYTKRRALH